MAKLVYLVIGDHLHAHELLHALYIIHGACHDGYARAGEGDLGGGGELVHHVGVSSLAAEGDDVGEGDIVAVKLMHAVGVVPHEHKVGGGGLHRGDAPDGVGGVDYAVGVGVLRHAPHALHGGILYKLLHGVHVGTGRGHGHGDKLKAEGFGDLEVPVIAGGGAEPFYLFKLVPRAGGVIEAVSIRL